MVKRLRVDSARDTKYFLRNVNLDEEPSSPEKQVLQEQKEFKEILESAPMSKEERHKLERTKELLTIV